MHLFNICVTTASFPSCWKLTRVVPVPKGKDTSDASGYSPVAILCAQAKVFGAAIYNCLYLFMGTQLG